MRRIARSKVLVVIGTRPEAIKLHSTILSLKACARIRCIVCLTGQHHELIDGILEDLRIQADIQLNALEKGQPLSRLSARVLAQVDALIGQANPNFLIVQGDTTSAFAAALAAFHRRVPIGHVEAGLRTGDLAAPWPEEANRSLIARLANLNFCPTRTAARNLRQEGIPSSRILITGNPVVDAVKSVAQQTRGTQFRNNQLRRAFVPSGRPSVVVTVHRRENHGAALLRVCEAIRQLAERFADHVFVLPVHSNPQVQVTLRREFRTGRANWGNILLVEPLGYHDYVHLMARSQLVISDSGGVQEEVPSLGVPLIILRQRTERPEVLTAGPAFLVGTDDERIVSVATDLLRARGQRVRRWRGNPFGDAKAGRRISDAVIAFLGR